jgi:hypothetical protein
MFGCAFNTATSLLTSVTSRLPARVLHNLDLLRKSRRVNQSLAVVGGKLVAARDTAAGKWVEGTLIVKRAKVPTRLPETARVPSRLPETAKVPSRLPETARADGWPPCFQPPASQCSNFEGSHRASPTNGFT